MLQGLSPSPQSTIKLLSFMISSQYSSVVGDFPRNPPITTIASEILCISRQPSSQFLLIQGGNLAVEMSHGITSNYLYNLENPRQEQRNKNNQGVLIA